jgi:hypothetical protein
MKSNLKMLLSTVGVAILLASPAMAKSPSAHHSTINHRAAPAGVYTPNGAYGSTRPNQQTNGNWWCVTHPSWDACHDPRENPQY